MRTIVHFDACALVSSGKPLGGVAAARKDVPEQCEHYLPAQTLRSEEVLTGQPTCATRVAGILLSQLSPIYQFVLFRAQVLQATGTPMTSILLRSPPGERLRTVCLQQSLEFCHCTSPLRIVQALPCQNWH